MHNYINLILVATFIFYTRGYMNKTFFVDLKHDKILMHKQHVIKVQKTVTEKRK